MPFTFNYWDNEPRQRALMTREDVAACIDYELMTKGILKVEAPILRPITPIELPTSTFFKVQGGMYDMLCFQTKEQAATCMALKPFKLNYSYECGAKSYYADPCEDLSVQSVQLASKADYLNGARIMKENKAAEEANAKAERMFADASKAMDEVTNGLFEDWMKRQSHEREAQQIKATWMKYLAMSQGNADIAATFLFKAFSEPEVQAAVDWLDEDWGASNPMNTAAVSYTKATDNGNIAFDIQF